MTQTSHDSARRYWMMGGPDGTLTSIPIFAHGPYCFTAAGLRYSVSIPPSHEYARDWLRVAQVNIPRRRMTEMRDPLARVEVIRSGYASLLRTFAAGTY